MNNNAVMCCLSAVLALGLVTVHAEGIRTFGDCERIVFLGDSITHGGYYVADLQVAWKVRHPDARPVFLNCGIGGDTAKKGFERIETDLVRERPDRVVVMFGMNDVTAGGIAAYREWMVKLCDAFDAKGWNVDLMTPTPYDEWNTNLTSKVDARRKEPALVECSVFARDLAKRRGYGFVDLYGPMKDFLIAHAGERVRPERVHPVVDEHDRIAALILEAAGEGKIDTKTVVPREMGLLRDRLFTAQSNRRFYAEYERMILADKADLADRDAAFAVLDRWMAWARKSIPSQDAKWHEERHRRFKDEMYGKYGELVSAEEAVRKLIFNNR